MKKKKLNYNLAEQEYRIVYHNFLYYIIKADELEIFNHWCDAQDERRHFPGNFEPYIVEDLEELRFKNWRRV